MLRSFFILLILLQSNAFTQMVLSGDATGSCDCFELTNTTAEAGSVWSPGTIDLNNPFDFSFEINLGADDVWGADGMMFALRRTGATTGGLGYGLGYAGIPNSIGIEVDTWNSSPTVTTDIVSDHVGMSSNGGYEHDLAGPFAIPNIEDGLYHTFRVTWDPVLLELETFIDGVSIFSYTGDIVTLFFAGENNVYFGWTGGTGGVSNIQSVCMYRTASFISDLDTVCVGQEVAFTDETISDLLYNDSSVVTYDWDFGDGNDTTSMNPVHVYNAVGTYTVTLTITDVSGCPSVATLEIEVLDPLDIDVAVTGVSCFGLDDGTALATPLTGTGPYTYLWDDPLAQTTAEIIDLAPNSYTVQVVDATGCPGDATVSIIEPDELLIDVVTTVNESCGLANGEITITPSGGTGPYEYSIDGGASYQVSNVFSDLVNGSYDILIRDANLCTVAGTAIVNLDSPFIFTDITATEEGCGPAGDGTITITVASGVAPYNYSIDGGATFQLSNSFTGLSAGTYDIVVTDDIGCALYGDVEVLNASLVNIDIVNTNDLLCNGDADGEIEIIASGGTPILEYSVDGGLTYVVSNVFTGLSGGDYDVIVRDINACTDELTVSILEPELLVIDPIIIEDVSCFGFDDGSINMGAIGGIPDYLYSVDNGVTFEVTGLFTDLAPGDYDLVIQDDNLCTQNVLVSIDEPAALAVDDIILTPVTCNGLADGEFEMIISGGTSPYEFSVDAGPFDPSPIISGLSAATYDVEIRDANLCTIATSATIDEPAPLVLTLGSDTTICLGGSATLCPNVGGGTPPYTYIWDGLVGASECLNTDVIAVHELQIEDANGCLTAVEEQIVFQYVPLSVITTPTQNVCPGKEVTFGAEGSGGGPGPFNYVWTNDVDASSLSGPVHTIYPFETTTYTVSIDRGCEDTATGTFLVNIFPIPNLVVGADVYEGCEDLTVNFVNLSDPDLVDLTIWDFGDGNSASGMTPTNLYPDPGCYDVSIDVKTVNGCRLEKTFDDLICVWQMPIADFEYLPAPPNLLERTVNFTNNSEYASSYIWSFGDDGGSSEMNPEHTYAEMGNMNYEVVLQAISDEGCVDEISKNILLEDVLLYYVPNAFTPDGDGYNSNFKPVMLPGFFPADYTFTIFNRWGELLFVSYNQNIGWDGIYGGQLVDDGVYIWEITYRENGTDRKHKMIGHVTVLK
jgi:gliding motility-associated-like protein